MRLGNVESAEEKLFYYMDELNKSMLRQIELHKEYDEMADKAKQLSEIALEWKSRADKCEKLLKDHQLAQKFNANIFNRQN